MIPGPQLGDTTKDVERSTTTLPFREKTLVVASLGMMIGERVAQRLKVLGISQAELGRRIGISQQAIGKLVNGGSRATTHIARIARELGTTPAFLEGETNDPTAEQPAATRISSETRELLDHFETLSPADRRAILQIARSLAGGAPPSETVHARGGGGKAALHDRQQQYRGER